MEDLLAERIMRLLCRKDYLISTDAVYLSNVFREMDNGKARRDLNWKPRQLEATVADTMRWYSAKAAADRRR